MVPICQEIIISQIIQKLNKNFFITFKKKKKKKQNSNFQNMIFKNEFNNKSKKLTFAYTK